MEHAKSRLYTHDKYVRLEPDIPAPCFCVWTHRAYAERREKKRGPCAVYFVIIFLLTLRLKYFGKLKRSRNVSAPLQHVDVCGECWHSLK